MTAQTFAQKILSARSGRPSVAVGEIVTVTPDHVLSHDNSASIYGTFRKMGAERFHDPSQPVIILDHCVPAASQKYAENHRIVRDMVKEHSLPNFFDIANGVCHQVLAEEGFAVPGGLILGSDSHTTTAGALGCFAAGIGRSEAASIWAGGTLWLRCPETIRVRVTGTMREEVDAKDLALEIIRILRADGALYRAVEFTGPGVTALSVEGRMVLANMAAEMGAKIGYVSTDDTSAAFLEGRARLSYDPVWSDADADFEADITVDLDSISPRVARPHTVDNVCPVSEVRGTRVDQVLIGTCTNGRFADIASAAAILAGRSVHPDVRLLVFPASMSVYREAMAAGHAETITAAGGLFMNPGCGPCLGAHEGILAPGEVCLSTANRNFRGRMGCPDAEIYLASPRTAAITAVKGVIDDAI